MDILIKSFNRPFYLDRCIASVYRLVEGDFSITVLDDGTPEKYLRKIQTAYPEIQILRSDSYDEKSHAIEENLKSGTEIDGNQIPVSFWIEAVKNSSEYFIITEDDVWFTNPINTGTLQNDAEKFNINLIKLGWLGNVKDDIYGESFPISEILESVQPKNLFLASEKVMKAFFLNDFKFFSLLYKLKLVDNETKNKYWLLNSILMGLYRKEYWLNIWKNMDGKVNEKMQLINASLFYRKHRGNPNFIARLKTEAMKTTFQSSATNSYHDYGCNFDVNRFNHILSEAWYKREFDAMENFPNDFNLAYLEGFIKDEMSVDEFRKWVDHFKNQYRKLGADVD